MSWQRGRVDLSRRRSDQEEGDIPQQKKRGGSCFPVSSSFKDAPPVMSGDALNV